MSASQPHRIQPEGHTERNLFLESLLANQPKSTERSSSLNQTPPLPSTRTGDISTLERLRPKHAQGLNPQPFAEPSTHRTLDNQQQGKTTTVANITDLQILSSKEFKEWSDQNAKGHTKSNFQTWVEERERDKRLLATSTGWSRGLSAKKMVMTKSAEVGRNQPHSRGWHTADLARNKEALPSTLQPAMEDTIMEGTKQSTRQPSRNPTASTKQPSVNLNLTTSSTERS